jgi:hypothetical protein
MLSPASAASVNNTTADGSGGSPGAAALQERLRAVQARFQQLRAASGST